MTSVGAPHEQHGDHDDLAAARAGDRAALERLLAAQQPRIYAFGLRMCRDPEDARDILQETMLAMAKGLSGFRQESSLSTWMFQIARSFCIKKRRRRKGAPAVTEPLEAGEEIAASEPGPEDVAHTKELKRALARALAQMPAAAREVVVLRDVEGLSAKEVADVLGTSVSAVKSRLHRARAQLEHELESVVAHAPAKKDCPDIGAMLSRQLEGDLTSELCAELEEHVAGCPHCSPTCDALKESLALCKALPEVPADVNAAVRAEIRRYLDELPRR